MPNGKPGDHPVTDLIIHGWHPFPDDIEALLLAIHAMEPLDARKAVWAEINDRAWGWQTNRLVSTQKPPEQCVLDEGRRWLREQVRRLKERD